MKEKMKLDEMLDKLNVIFSIAIPFFIAIGAVYVYNLNNSNYIYISDILIKVGIGYLIIHTPLMLLLGSKNIKTYVATDIVSSLFFLPFFLMQKMWLPIYDYLILLAVPFIIILLVYMINKREVPIITLSLIAILAYIVSIYFGHLQGIMYHKEAYYSSDYRVVMFIGIQVAILLINLIYIIGTKKSKKELISGAVLIIIGSILFLILNCFLNPYASASIIVGIVGVVFILLLMLDENCFRDYLPGINIAFVALMIYFIVDVSCMKLSFSITEEQLEIGYRCYAFLVSAVVISGVLFLEYIYLRRTLK